MIQQKIGFIGAGRMAESLISGMLEAGLAPAGRIFASDPSEERRQAVRRLIGENVFSDNSELVDACDVIVLSVKPNVLAHVAAEVAVRIGERRLLLSIAPGITLKQLAKQFGATRVIRAMPNTPATVGMGATAFCTSKGVDEGDSRLAESIFSAVGLCIEVTEDLMDAVTGLSGSGPAYAFMAIQALSDGGVKMGLGRADATRLAAQTLLGAAGLVLSSGEHPEKLKDAVTTPGGTTIEGLHALERSGFRKALIDAVEAATLKSRELGRGG